MRRREVILALGGMAAGPLAARAQQPDRVRRVGMLVTYAESDPESQARLQAFRQRLRELGWIQERGFQIDYRYVPNLDRIQDAAIELVELHPDVIVANGNPGTAALLRSTHDIPIVFVLTTDPVGSGFVASLPRPGGNATGFTNFEFSLGSKWLELLKEIAPRITRVAAILHVETMSNTMILRAAESSARALGVSMTNFPVHDADEIVRAITGFATEPHSGLLVIPHPVTIQNRELIAHLAARLALPSIYAYTIFVRAGGLLSYGISTLAVFRQSASYVDRILKGTKPSELPVQQPTQFEMAINIKSAKALGLDVPQTLIARADEVIE